ncbi:hypothetical protein E4U32_000640 [Claviceps aff. humidiphila group G2b]|nr:hypothetical protein E4U32_000640 [Claviceps aff. humidiphila group G2b]
MRRSQMHTDARTISTISVAEDAADGDGINKLVHQYRSDCETLQPHSIWTVITATSAHLSTSLEICRERSVHKVDQQEEV